MKNIFKLFATASVLIALIGCTRVLPVYNVDNQAVNYGLSVAKVEKAILDAGVTKRWNMRVVAPGKIQAHVLVRSHKAEVDIFYSEKDYSIKYRDSMNLLYEDGKIHRNYNKWITLLDQEIQRNLSIAQ